MSRLADLFAKCRSENRAALVAYLMAGDPDLAGSLEYFRAALSGGADILEIGIPFSDPIADGPVIQAAAGRALASGATLENILPLVRALRGEFPAAGLVVMSYLNPLLSYSEDTLTLALAEAGADGLLPTDLPPGAERLLPGLEGGGLARIALVADSTAPARLPAIFKTAGGFVYYIARRGVTGERSGLPAELRAAVEKLKAQSPLPVVVGFGLSRPEDIAAAAVFSDGVVVGSALVRMAGERVAPAALRARVAQLRAACARGVRP
jgi:tryptophan synthase alpha chain